LRVEANSLNSQLQPKAGKPGRTGRFDTKEPLKSPFILVFFTFLNLSVSATLSDEKRPTQTHGRHCFQKNIRTGKGDND
jgi:hypothetical protein